MYWIVSLITSILLVIFFFWFIRIKNKPKETKPAILLTLAFLVYHIGDLGLWAGWDYEVFRRIASIGFYLIIPFSLLLMYMVLSKDHMNLFVRIVTLIFILPWITYIVLIGNYPLVYLDTYELIVPCDWYVQGAILIFVVGAIWAIINGYRAGKLRADALGKKLGNLFATGLLVYTVLLLCMYFSFELFDVDLSWLMDIATFIYILLICIGLNVKSEAK